MNTASRMESIGEVRQVNISEATYALVKEVVEGANAPHATRQPATKHAFTFTPRGKVRAKGKGEMEMYFVEKRIDRTPAPDTYPTIHSFEPWQPPFAVRFVPW